MRSATPPRKEEDPARAKMRKKAELALRQDEDENVKKHFKEKKSPMMDDDPERIQEEIDTNAFADFSEWLGLSDEGVVDQEGFRPEEMMYEMDHGAATNSNSFDEVMSTNHLSEQRAREELHDLADTDPQLSKALKFTKKEEADNTSNVKSKFDRNNKEMDDEFLARRRAERNERLKRKPANGNGEAWVVTSMPGQEENDDAASDASRRGPPEEEKSYRRNKGTSGVNSHNRYSSYNSGNDHWSDRAERQAHTSTGPNREQRRQQHAQATMSDEDMDARSQHEAYKFDVGMNWAKMVGIQTSHEQSGKKKKKERGSWFKHPGQKRWSWKNIKRGVKELFQSERTRVFTKVGMFLTMETMMAVITRRFHFESGMQAMLFLGLTMGMFALSHALADEGVNVNKYSFNF